jgi:FkbM family methyltransferase
MFNRIIVPQLKVLFGKLGFVLQRKQPWMNNHKWLIDYDIKTVIDIGANVGGFALEFAEILPNATFYAFEPIPSVFNEMVSNTKNINVKAFNYGLGDKAESISINVNEFSPSSSILELADLHKENFKNSVKVTKETISIKILDEEFKVSDFNKNIFVKIDVQGFEDKTINGAKQILRHTKVVLVEMTFKELYKDQKLFHDIYMQLYELGFEYNGAFAQNYDEKNGSMIYADAFFINRNF